MGIIARLFGRERPEFKDAEQVYSKLLAQSRQPAFFGETRVPDSYDGRIDLLTLHMTVVMRRLNQLGDNGKRLSQALFDAMVDDFDIALRGEGLTDSGVSRRIKPLVGHFYARLKTYTEALDGTDEDMTVAITSGPCAESDAVFVSGLAGYARELTGLLDEQPLGGLAQAKIDFPEVPSSNQH